MRLSSVVALAVALWLSLPREAVAEASLNYKFQHYQETDGRIGVIAHYASAHVDMATETKLSVVGLVDVISGATPTGVTPPDGSDQVPLANMDDKRYAGVVDITHKMGDNQGRLEYAHSYESDYVSNGISAGWIRDFNKRNTSLRLSFAYNDDKIQPAFFDEARGKITRDFLVGLTQVLGPRTTITANLAFGTASGFLSDPYKLVSKSIEIVPGFPLKLTFPENRPNRREKVVGFVETTHLFENVRGTAQTSLRYYTDDHGIDSGTLELAWFQRFRENWIIRPSFRFYRQSAADYYIFDLDQTSIIPVSEPDGSPPHYSSDYRISEFDATTLGLKIIYKQAGQWAVDATYERYQMRGRDGVTPASAFPTANIFTLGARIWF